MSRTGGCSTLIDHRPLVAPVGSDVPSRLLSSARADEEIIYRRELETLAARDGALAVIHTLTRSRPASWRGYPRRIAAEMLAKVAWSPRCGR